MVSGSRVALPRVVVAAAASGQGKTSIATGLIAALRSRGLAVSAHKVGPDYIDPGYHGLAAGRPGRNLDPWLVGEERVLPLFVHGATTPTCADIAILEGVMGLFDGAHGHGDFASTAHVARLLQAPVVLVVDGSAVGRSVAAVVHGFATFDPTLRIAGVILNRVGSEPARATAARRCRVGGHAGARRAASGGPGGCPVAAPGAGARCGALRRGDGGGGSRGRTRCPLRGPGRGRGPGGRRPAHVQRTVGPQPGRRAHAARACRPKAPDRRRRRTGVHVQLRRARRTVARRRRRGGDRRPVPRRGIARRDRRARPRRRVPRGLLGGPVGERDAAQGRGRPCRLRRGRGRGVRGPAVPDAFAGPGSDVRRADRASRDDPTVDPRLPAGGRRDRLGARSGRHASARARVPSDGHHPGGGPLPGLAAVRDRRGGRWRRTGRRGSRGGQRPRVVPAPALGRPAADRRRASSPPRSGPVGK